MRVFSCLALALLLGLSVASSAVAKVATIQTTAPQQDHAKPSIEAAFKEAMQTAELVRMTEQLEILPPER